MEYLDIYDDERNKTGQTTTRGHITNKNNNLLAVFIVVFNHEGKMLIQKRSPDKFISPGVWDLSAGGAVLSGESSFQGAYREAMEEIGYRLDSTRKKPVFSEYYSTFIVDYYLAQTDWDLSKFKIQKEEVDEIKYCDLSEIETLMQKKLFREHSLNIIRLLFEINQNIKF
ncbi:NUDIX domain-containing protein [Mycoplasmopsis phocirhinis]|uniref:NUDIX domain-containing protein n=1 Tax=Mycoplasmopsis phocirhinis TaxID=142650 RepID=A0A4P6MNB2_9BACT|nr:NUDIX domain-containing protein [Mycoplasmopsis phocirhinis]QBF34370.1 NUDIX domain-containing protein [Mycoplasmopsis phocirhinis]